jgi:hypothetical protein
VRFANCGGVVYTTPPRHAGSRASRQAIKPIKMPLDARIIVVSFFEKDRGIGKETEFLPQNIIN